VWHYYLDGKTGRIYNKTKTEVSADGVNWTTLYDSAISGTYAEPKGGSGRKYEVKLVDDSEKVTELEIFLDDLLSEFELLSFEDEGDRVEINSTNYQRHIESVEKLRNYLKSRNT